MTSSDQQDRPWTTGPWAVNRSEHSEFEVETIGPAGQQNYQMRGGVGWLASHAEDAGLQVSDADALLISLAPEMAEAILEYERVYSLPRGEFLESAARSGEALRAIAARLRDIGGES